MKQKEITKWEQVYQLPLSYDGIHYAWTKDNNMALMFEHSISEKDRNLIVDAINGESKLKVENLTFKGCDFLLEGGHIFCVRGWGNLTGIGGLNLPEEKAEEIQDGFIQHIYESLSYKEAVLIDVVGESKNGFSCPKCDTTCSEQSLVSQTETVFKEAPDPHYSWDETHKCTNCGTLYFLHNGT